MRVSTFDRATTALVLGALLATSCARDPEPARPRFELRAVVAPAIAELERAVVTEPAPVAADPELVERVRGLVLDLPAAQGRMRALHLEEIASIGEPAVAVLAACLAEEALAHAQHLAAVELCGAIEGRAASDLLISQVESAREPSLRANAAWQLSKSSRDEVVPRLLLRLKYEVDGEVVVWIARALASFGNLAGLDGLFVVMQDDARPELALSAVDRLEEIATAAGADVETLRRAWIAGEQVSTAAQTEPSAPHRLEIWRRIGRLAEHDLRPVDDARFVLSRSAAWVAGPLAEALHDEDVYTRVYAAQCLERMGPRGRSAGPELVLALDEPRIASAAARALGAIGVPGAVDALRERLALDTEPELRVAATQALGDLGDPTLVADLRPLLAPEEPLDLRQAAAQSIAALGGGAEVEAFLLECLTSARADASGAEAALELLLVERASRDDAARLALERWRALAAPPGSFPAPGEVLARQRARAELLRAP